MLKVVTTSGTAVAWELEQRLPPEQQQLLARIFLSRHFSQADLLRRILQYLSDHTVGPDSRSVNEYEIAVCALGRPESFSGKSDPVVRVSIASIRERLGAYFKNEGREETTVLVIPKGRYQVLFTERTVEPVVPAGAVGDRIERPALRRWWRPYLAADALNAVMYTEPLFLRDDETGLYMRSLYVNDEAADEMTKLPNHDGGPLTPCYHYLSAGEVHSAFALLRMAHELDMPLDVQNARLSTLNHFRFANLILLGSSRTNHFMDTLQRGEGFIMTAAGIDNPHAQPGEEMSYTGQRYMDGKLPRFTDYVLITRRPGLSPGSTVTVVASNHGRAIQGGGVLLTNETQVASLLESMGMATTDPLPSYFQALLKVEMIGPDDEVVTVSHVAHRILD